MVLSQCILPTNAFDAAQGAVSPEHSVAFQAARPGEREARGRSERGGGPRVREGAEWSRGTAGRGVKSLLQTARWR